jgi:hypothetical protein
VVAAKFERRRIQPEPATLRDAQGAHPVGAGHLGDASKNRTMRSKVCSRSIEVVNHHSRHRDQNNVAAATGECFYTKDTSVAAPQWASSPGPLCVDPTAGTPRLPSAELSGLANAFYFYLNTIVFGHYRWLRQKAAKRLASTHDR